MAAQVNQGEKKDDPLKGAAIQMAASYAMSKLDAKGKECDCSDDQPPECAPCGQFDAGPMPIGKTDANPRDRRMYSKYA